MHLSIQSNHQLVSPPSPDQATRSTNNATPWHHHKNDNDPAHRRQQSIDDFSIASSSSSEMSDSLLLQDQQYSIDCRPSSRRLNPRRRRHKRQKHVELPAQSEFCAIDCEMVGNGPKGRSSSVGRVTVIDWYGNVLMDEHIQQTQEVTDYRTFVSGITSDQLENATLSIDACREQVLTLLEEHPILVGHALKNDLRALEISHPWYLTRDTGKYEPFMQVRFDDGILWPRKLKDLTKERLQQDIQVSGQPHSPYEDAFAALELYQSVRPKWEKVIQYKVQKTNQIHKREKNHQHSQEGEEPAPLAQ